MARSRVLFPRLNSAGLLCRPVAIDYSHPLANGLVGYWLLNDGSALDYSSQANSGSLVNGPSLGISPLGPALNFASASSQYANVPDAASLRPSEMSYAAWITPASFPNAYNTIIHKGDGSFFLELFVKSTGKLALYTHSGNYDGSGANTLAAGTSYCLAATSSASSLLGYVNGAVDGSGGAGALTLPSGAPLSIGRDSITAGRYWNGLIGPAAVWNRALSAAEVAWLNAEPFAMLRPIARRSYSIASAVGVGFTGTAPVGSLGVAAWAAALALGLGLSSSPAALVSAGLVSTVGAGLSVTAPAAGAVERGAAGTANAGATALAQSAGLTVAGQPGTASAGFSGAPGRASGGVSGAAASFAAAFTATPGAGAAAASGKTAALSLGSAFASAPSAFAFGGYAGSFSSTTGFSGIGLPVSLAASGHPGSVTAPASLAAPIASASIAGYAATFALGSGFTALAPIGALGMSSFPSTLSTAGNFAAPNAGAAISGRPGSVLAGTVTIASAGALAVRSVPSAVSTGATLTAASNRLLIGGYAATWSATGDILVRAPAAFLAIGGAPSFLTIGINAFVAPSAALASFGYAASFTIPAPLVFASVELAPDQWSVELPLEVSEMLLPMVELGPKNTVDSGWVRIGMTDWIASLQLPDGTSVTPVPPISVVSLDPAYVVSAQQIIGTDCYLFVSGGTPNGIAVLALVIRLTDGSVFERYVAQPVDG